jgi:hypothetical protein
VSDGELTNRIHPKSHIGELRGLLPQKYSPLRANGDGLQSVYLAEVGHRTVEPITNCDRSRATT